MEMASEITLVKSEDMSKDKCKEEDHVTNIDEFVVDDNVQETLAGVYDLAVGMLEAEGYRAVIARHPRYGRDVAHFVLGDVVIVADYCGTNLLTLEVLPENEAKIVRAEELKS